MLGNGFLSQAGVEFCGSAQKVASVQIAQGQVGVGYCGAVTTFIVGSRARQGTSTLRSNLHYPARADRSDAATTRTHSVNIDHGYRDFPPRLKFLCAQVGLAVLNQ